MKHPPSSPDLESRVAEEALWTESKVSWKHEMKMLDIATRLQPKKDNAGARAGTLVICPVIALHQWKSEIEKFTEKSDTLTIGTYHGPNRAKEMPAAMMSKYDIILTTYQCLEQDFRKMMSPNKVSCVRSKSGERVVDVWGIRITHRRRNALTAQLRRKI